MCSQPCDVLKRPSCYKVMVKYLVWVHTQVQSSFKCDMPQKYIMHLCQVARTLPGANIDNTKNLFHFLDGASAMHNVKEICEGLFRYHPLYFPCSVQGQKQMVVSPWCQLLMLHTWQNHAQGMMQLHCNNKTAVKPPYNLVAFEL